MLLWYRIHPALQTCPSRHVRLDRLDGRGPIQPPVSCLKLLSPRIERETESEGRKVGRLNLFRVERHTSAFTVRSPLPVPAPFASLRYVSDASSDAAAFERVLAFEGVHNVRDIGGYPT